MQAPENANFDRKFFLDNIRSLMIFLVVVLHGAAAYSSITNWTVIDAQSIFFDYLVEILDLFIIPALFFIAGYFALPSLQKRGTWLFIKGKLRRLGIPWLIGIILLRPFVPYLYFYSHGLPSTNLWGSFVQNIKGALSFHTGFVISKSRIQFDHHHFWFLSLLLAFFIVFALLHQYKKGVFTGFFSSRISEVPSNRSILLTLFLVTVLSATLTFAVRGLFYYYGPARQPWFIIVSLINFQTTKLLAYILCFSLGIYASSRNWFSNTPPPGHFIYWALLGAALWYCQVEVKEYVSVHHSPPLAFILVFLRTCFSFSILFAFITFAITYWNRPSQVSGLFAANSYNIYLLHMIFVLALQFFLINWMEISIFIKFGMVTFLSVVLSYTVSQYAIRPFPRLTVLGMTVLFAFLAVFLPASP